MTLSLDAFALSRTIVRTDFYIAGFARPLLLANADVPKANPVPAAASGTVKALGLWTRITDANTAAIDAFSVRTAGLGANLDATFVTSPPCIAHALTIRATAAVGAAHLDPQRLTGRRNVINAC